MMPKKKIVLITQSNYIPWKGYFDAINMADVFVVYDEVQYTRRDWRNRNLIKTPSGLHWLTIPVDVKGKYSQPINATRISDKSWNERHWKTIQLNYARALFFKEHRDFFENLYLGCNELFLSRINHRFLKEICVLLKIETEFLLSSDFEGNSDKSERLLNICKELGATEYISGPAAKDYLDTRIFSAADIKVTWLDYSGYKPYHQLFGDFEHRVSVVDLIFNVGHEAADHLKSMAKEIKNED